MVSDTAGQHEPATRRCRAGTALWAENGPEEFLKFP
jgi:hypothetical protein